MKKTLLTLAVTVALTSSVAMAAPLTDLQKGNSAAGYLYWNPDITSKAYGHSYDAGNVHANGAYAETAVSDKVIVGIETISGSSNKNISGMNIKEDTRFTDLTVQYKIDNNFRVIAGNRNYDTTASASHGGYSASASNSENKFIYGIGATTTIGENTAAYATYLHDDYANEWQLGVNQNLSKNITLNLNYRSHDENSVELKGIGAGLIYKF
jgi:opacity protein-like surface antigen